jgi:uncharacterized delta-60 repeat protein
MVQPDGKILVAGQAYNGLNTSDFALVRYNADGTLDTTFSDDGKVITPVGLANDLGYSVALQPDGKILVAGHIDNSNHQDFALVRIGCMVAWNLEGYTPHTLLTAIVAKPARSSPNPARS